MEVATMIKLGSGATGILGAIIGAAFWINANVVFASGYAQDQLERQQMDVQILLELNYDRLDRATTPEKKKEIERKIKRLENQLEKLDERIIEENK